MTRWTPAAIEELKHATCDLRAINEATRRNASSHTMILLTLIEIGLRVVDPSPEDVERIARALFVEMHRGMCVGGGYLWADQPKEVTDNYRDEARAVLAAIAEGDENARSS